jgi:hypothetical protein
MRINNKTLYVIIIAKIVSVLLAISALTACSDTSNEYRRYTVHESLGRFSIEYPETYNEPLIQIIKDSFGEDIYLETAHNSENQSIDSIFSIHLTRAKENENANIFLQRQLDYDAKVAADFSLLERSDTIVSGKQAEQFIYSYTRLPDTYHGEEGGSSPWLQHSVFFDVDGVIWSIRFSSTLSRWDAGNSEFSHLIATLKIIN